MPNLQSRTATTTLDPTDIGYHVRDPSGTPADRKITVQNEAQAHDGMPAAVNQQTGTSYTLVLTDRGKVLEMSNAAAITLTIPANSSVEFPVGTLIYFFQMGAGAVTVAGASPGPTLNSRSGTFISNGQFSMVGLYKNATDSWIVFGDLA